MSLASLLSFNGELGRFRYAIGSIGVFFTQHLLVYLVFALARTTPEAPWWFWLNPLRVLAEHASTLPGYILLLAMAAVIAVDALLATLAFQRAQQAPSSAAFATLAIVPVAQVFAILWLSIAPHRRERAQTQPTASRAAP